MNQSLYTIHSLSEFWWASHTIQKMSLMFPRKTDQLRGPWWNMKCEKNCFTSKANMMNHILYTIQVSYFSPFSHLFHGSLCILFSQHHVLYYNWTYNNRMRPRSVAKCCSQCSLHISIENRKLIFFDQITLDLISSKSYFPTLCMVSQITSQSLKYFLRHLGEM